MMARILRWAVLLVFLAIVLLPLIWLLGASLEPNQELFSRPGGLASVHWGFQNYGSVLVEAPMLLYLFNSLFVSRRIRADGFRRCDARRLRVPVPVSRSGGSSIPFSPSGCSFPPARS